MTGFPDKLLPALLKTSIGNSMALAELNVAVASLTQIVGSLIENSASSISEDQVRQFRGEFDTVVTSLEKTTEKLQRLHEESHEFDVILRRHDL